MITCFGKSCLFGFKLCVLSICVCVSFPFGFEDGIYALIVLVPDHCLSFYFGIS